MGLNNSVIPEDKDTTQKILNEFDFDESMQRDIDEVQSEVGQGINMDDFQDFLDQRVSEINSWNSRAGTITQRLNSGDASFGSAFELLEAPRGSDRVTLNVREVGSLRSTLSDSQTLIGQLTVMLKMALDGLDKTGQAIELQKSRQHQMEAVKFLRRNIDNMVGGVVEDSVEDAVENGINNGMQAEELKARVDALEEQLDKIKATSGVDIDEVVEQVRESGFKEEVERSVDLEQVLINSDVGSRKEIGIILKNRTSLTNQQIADIFDMAPGSVANWG